MVFVSGQLGLDPVSGELAEGVEKQAVQALENLKAILTEAGSSLERVVKTVVYLQSMEDFAAVNQVYATYFTQNYPARSCFAVAGLPKGCLLYTSRCV